MYISHRYVHDTTLPRGDLSKTTVFTLSGVGLSWKPDNEIGQQHGEMVIA